MPRVHFVKKAQKDNPVCKKGESYYWWGMMSGGRYGPKRYSKTAPKPSQLTNSEFLGTMGDIEEELASLSADDSLEGAVEDIVNRLRELGEETQGKYDNMPDSLQQGEIGQLLEERANKCGEIADELENITFDVSDKTEDQSDEDYWQEKLDEVQAVDTSV